MAFLYISGWPVTDAAAVKAGCSIMGPFINLPVSQKIGDFPLQSNEYTHETERIPHRYGRR